MQNQVNQSDIDRFFVIDTILLSTFFLFQVLFDQILELMPKIAFPLSGILNLVISVYLIVFVILIKKFRKEQQWRFIAALTRVFCLIPITWGNVALVRDWLGVDMQAYSVAGIVLFGIIFMTGEIVSRQNSFKFLSVPLVLSLILLMAYSIFRIYSYSMPFNFKIATYVLLSMTALTSLYAFFGKKKKYTMRYLVGSVIIIIIAAVWEPGQISAEIIDAFMDLK